MGLRDDVPTMDTSPRPDARARAGLPLLLLAVVLVAFSMRSPITGVGAVLPVLSDDLDLSTTAAGVLTSLPLLAFAVSSVVVPRVSRRLGVQPTVVAALGLLVAGAVLRAVPGVVPLFLGTVALGVAIAVANVLLPVVVRVSFPTRVALVTSVYVVSMQVAGGVASGVSVPLSQALPGGWRTALAVWGVPALLGALLWAPRLRGGGGRPVVGAGHARTPWGSPLAWAVTAFMGTQSMVFYSVLAWLPTVLRDRAGVQAAQAGVQLSVLQAAGVVAGLCVPLLTRDSVARTRRTMVGVSACSLVGVAALLVAPGAATVGVLFVGFGTGGGIVLALGAMTARAADAQGAVALSGMAQSVGYLVAASGPVLAGALHAATGSWEVVLGVLCVVALGQVVTGAVAGRDATV